MLDKSGDQVVPPWTTRLPGLLELGGGWRRGLPLLLVVVIAIPLLFYVLYASLRRLHFLDVLDAPDAEVQPPSDMLHRIDSDPALQRVVANLVLQGIVTPHPDNRDAVRTLVAWRVIDPETLVLDAPELVTHIRAHHRNGTLHKAPQNGGSWQVLKMPVVTALLVAAGALAALQPDMGAVGLLAPGLAAALPVVLRAIAAFATQLDGNG